MSHWGNCEEWLHTDVQCQFVFIYKNNIVQPLLYPMSVLWTMWTLEWWSVSAKKQARCKVAIDRGLIHCSNQIGTRLIDQAGLVSDSRSWGGGGVNNIQYSSLMFPSRHPVYFQSTWISRQSSEIVVRTLDLLRFRRDIDDVATVLYQIQNCLTCTVTVCRTLKLSRITPLRQLLILLTVTEGIEYKVLTLTYNFLQFRQPS